MFHPLAMLDATVRKVLNLIQIQVSFFLLIQMAENGGCIPPAGVICTGFLACVERL